MDSGFHHRIARALRAWVVPAAGRDEATTRIAPARLRVLLSKDGGKTWFQHLTLTEDARRSCNDLGDGEQGSDDEC